LFHAELLKNKKKFMGDEDENINTSFLFLFIIKKSETTVSFLRQERASVKKKKAASFFQTGLVTVYVEHTSTTSETNDKSGQHGKCIMVDDYAVIYAHFFLWD
jgi:hypothetical protein